MLSLTKPSIISRIWTSMVKTMSIFFLSLFVSVPVPINVTTSSSWVLSCCKYYVHEEKIFFYLEHDTLSHTIIFTICVHCLFHCAFIPLGYLVEDILDFCGPPYLIGYENHHSLKLEYPFCSRSSLLRL